MPWIRAAPGSLYQLKITLMGISPRIWRRVLIDSASPLEDLHYVIQVAMPWSNSHLHHFINRDGTYYSDTRFGLENIVDEVSVRLDQVLKRPKDKIIYEYDFGDSWQHEIVLEKVMPLGAGEDLPRCNGGKNAGPPDDCGGVWGYADLLDALENKDHDNHDCAVEVLGKKFNPDAFDPEEVNRQLKKVFKPEKKPRKPKKKPGAAEE